MFRIFQRRSPPQEDVNNNPSTGDVEPTTDETTLPPSSPELLKSGRLRSHTTPAPSTPLSETSLQEEEESPGRKGVSHNTGAETSDMTWSSSMDTKISQAITSVFRKVTSILDYNRGGRGVRPGDVVLDRGDVCSGHAIMGAGVGETEEHQYGRMVVHCQLDENGDRTLILTLTPNSPHSNTLIDSAVNSELSPDISYQSGFDDGIGLQDSGLSSPVEPHSRSKVTDDTEDTQSSNTGSDDTTSVTDFCVNDLTGVFTVDLGRLRSIRLFFAKGEAANMAANTSSEENGTAGDGSSRLRSFTWAGDKTAPAGKRGQNGQMVLVSSEAQFKVLDFHQSGLDAVDSMLDAWSGLFDPKFRRTIRGLDRHFMIYQVVPRRSSVPDRHPEEGKYPQVTRPVWLSFQDAEGRITNPTLFKKTVFFGGIDPDLRAEIWPFLLKYFPFDSTRDDRVRLRAEARQKYEAIDQRRRHVMSHPESEAEFERDIGYTVEKDVLRTDRSRTFYAGPDNANVDILKEILLNLAIAHPSIGYTQGMSDLLAPVLELTQDAVDAYWCFDGLMRKTIFISSPKETDIGMNLTYLRELLRLLTPNFFLYLEDLGGNALDLLFSHRWILLCFKREFVAQEALYLWEACWSHCETDYFHLFLCVAIVTLYTDQVVIDHLPSDDMLLFFAQLAQNMDVNKVLCKARGLVHQFRARDTVPCSLASLCTLCGPGMWDSKPAPRVKCIGHPPDFHCQFAH